MRREKQVSGRQCAGAVLMIRPASFDYNPETAETNRMQRRAPRAGRAAARAIEEFDLLARALQSAGVAVCVVEDTPDPPKPDAVFPNNWVSFHADGTVVLYPMQAESRRRERRKEVVDAVAERLGFEVSRVVDLTGHEAEGRYLEGTGSLVLDHVDRVAYACLSPRTHPQVVHEWAREMGYEPLVFRAFDRSGVPPYHTNVLMSIGAKAAVIGSQAIPPDERARVLERLAASGREIIEIDPAQIERFAGNMLELASRQGAPAGRRVVVMSASARESLDAETYACLSACTDEVLVAAVPVIETLGGGSVRCMLAEVFLPDQTRRVGGA